MIHGLVVSDEKVFTTWSISMRFCGNCCGDLVFGSFGGFERRNRLCVNEEGGGTDILKKMRWIEKRIANLLNRKEERRYMKFQGSWMSRSLDKKKFWRSNRSSWRVSVRPTAGVAKAITVFGAMSKRPPAPKSKEYIITVNCPLNTFSKNIRIQATKCLGKLRFSGPNISSWVARYEPLDAKFPSLDR